MGAKYTVKRLIRRLPGDISVYEALQNDLDRKVEIRVFERPVKEGSDEFLRFDRECKTLATLDHPNIIKVYDWGIANGKVFYVTEACKGLSLEEYAERAGGGPPFDATVAMSISLDVAKALAYLHRHNIVHRDVTFSSVYYYEERKRAYFANFAVVKNFNLDDLTAKGVRQLHAMGLTPETVNGLPITPALDIYMLGAFMYRLLCGRDPLDSSCMEIRTGSGPFDFKPPSSFRSGVSSMLERIVMRCLAEEPSARPSDTDTLVRKLEETIAAEQQKKKLSTLRMKAVEAGGGGAEDDPLSSSAVRKGRSSSSLSLSLTSIPALEERSVLERLQEWFEENVSGPVSPRALLLCVLGVVFLLLLLLYWLRS